MLSVFQDFFSLIFPVYCQACYEPLSKGEETICIKCMAAAPKTRIDPAAENELMNRLTGIKSLDGAGSFLKFIKNGKVQRLLHNLKYENRPEIGEKLGRWYGHELKEAGFQRRVDLIIPVPLHVSKLRKRGYNQSSSFAKGLSDALDIPWHDHALIRIRKSETQTKKSKADRWRNVSGVFRVIDRTAVRGKKILLVDDVITTGSTLEACAEALEPYCRSVSVATIAMAGQ